MSKMYLMCGLSGAGKTTFAKEFVKENNLVYVSIDDFYKKNGGVYNDETGFYVWIEFYKAIHMLEWLHADILIDTNAPTFVKRQQFIDWFPTFDEYNLIYINIKDEELRKRNNASRGRIVPADEMIRMREEFEEPIAMLDTEANVYLYPEKRWNSIMVYINKNNNFVACKNSY